MWCHRYTRWPHHHEVTVLWQDASHHVRSLWYQNYDINIVRFVWGHSDTSWAHHHDVTILWQYDVTDTQDDYATMRSQCRHSVICHRYMRWPHHHEVTVLSQDDAHHVRSLWYQNYDITSVKFLWGHSDRSWAHHLEVTVLSQYDVTGTRDDQIIMKSQWCHRTMTTLWGHYDVLMISKLWHHMCEMVVRSQWQMFTTSPCGHSVVIECHRYTRWPHHYEVTVLSHCDVTDTWIHGYDHITRDHSVVTERC